MSSSPLRNILARKQILSIDQICHAVAYGHGGNATWIEQLLMWRAIDEQALVACISEAATVPRCNLDCLARLSYDVINAIPPELCAEHRVMPVGIEPDGDLRVALVDPCDDAALEELEFFLDRRILREVAPASAIAWALHHYHGTSTPLWDAQRQAASLRAA